MAAQLDIVNLALIRFGQKTIASMTEASPAARAANILWDPVRRAALRGYPWNFATRFLRNLALSPAYAQCGQTPTPTLPCVPDYQFAYVLPTDCIKAIKVHNPASKWLALDLWDDAFFDTYPAAIMQGLFNENETDRFVVREKFTLYTDVPCAGVFYTFDCADTAAFDDRFVEALSYRLAMDLAGTITQSAQKVQAMTQLYQASLASARVMDAQEAKTRVVAGQSFLRSRV